MKVKIKNNEILKSLDNKEYVFPKYVSQLLNLANSNAQGTRPRVVGQMTELMQEFDGKSYEDWKKWYLKQKPDAIENATKRVHGMVNNFQSVIKKIDKKMVKKWMHELVLKKTFAGLRFQEAILKKIANLEKTKYRLAKPSEESKGIDGYVGKIPVSIKPHTYSIMNRLPENIEVSVIKYEKKKDGIVFEYQFE